MKQGWIGAIVLICLFGEARSDDQVPSEMPGNVVSIMVPMRDATPERSNRHSTQSIEANYRTHTPESSPASPLYPENTQPGKARYQVYTPKSNPTSPGTTVAPTLLRKQRPQPKTRHQAPPSRQTVVTRKVNTADPLRTRTPAWDMTLPPRHGSADNALPGASQPRALQEPVQLGAPFVQTPSPTSPTVAATTPGTPPQPDVDSHLPEIIPPPAAHGLATPHAHVLPPTPAPPVMASPASPMGSTPAPHAMHSYLPAPVVSAPVMEPAMENVVSCSTNCEQSRWRGCLEKLHRWLGHRPASCGSCTRACVPANPPLYLYFMDPPCNDCKQPPPLLCSPCPAANGQQVADWMRSSWVRLQVWNANRPKPIQNRLRQSRGSSADCSCPTEGCASSECASPECASPGVFSRIKTFFTGLFGGTEAVAIASTTPLPHVDAYPIGAPVPVAPGMAHGHYPVNPHMPKTTEGVQFASPYDRPWLRLAPPPVPTVPHAGPVHHTTMPHPPKKVPKAESSPAPVKKKVSHLQGGTQPSADLKPGYWRLPPNTGHAMFSSPTGFGVGNIR